jgi:AhpD family alkylhydroperoxidase
MADYVVPTPRLNAKKEQPEIYKAMLQFGYAAYNGMDPKLAELVKIRTSQINGCAYCVDKHTRDALKIDDPRRINLVATWHEAPFFTAKERAALALTEAMTLITEGHVPDDVWQEAEKHFDPAELSQLALAIAAMNAMNRMGVSTRLTPA